MLLDSSLILFAVICVIVFFVGTLMVEVEVQRPQKVEEKPQSKDPHYLRAMEELDDIDRLIGLLPPKEEPKVKVKISQLRPTPGGIGAAHFKDWRKIGPVEHERRMQKIEEAVHCMVCAEPGVHTHMMEEATVMCDDGTSYAIGTERVSYGPQV